MTEVMQGAEPFSAQGGAIGALVVHGFTGSPQSMRPLAEAFAAAGYTVELPLLPGHGTSVEDMLTTGWSDWSSAVEAAYQDLARRCERVVVAGLSMGGTLTLWLAVHHPEIAAIVPINAAVGLDPDLAAGVQSLVDAGQEVMDAIGNDVADPEVTELAYDKTPLRPLLSLAGAIDDLAAALPEIRCPTLVVVSDQDHVVPPQSSDAIDASVSGPVEVLRLSRSYHVATIDYDRDLINERAVAFADRALSAAR
jgi:carboxylesterase